MPPEPQKKKIPRWVWIVLALVIALPFLKIAFVWLTYFIYGFATNVPA